MKLLGWLVSNAAALAVAAWLIDGIRFTGPTSGGDEIRHKLLPLIGVALILGVVSALVKPVLTVLSLPLVILTLGLFLLVINAVMLLITDWLADQLGIGFDVTGFWPAVGGAIVITIVTWFVGRALDGAHDR
ncbi:putative membrane protein [Nocardioides terrae]|uniref:Putative membrane protein n=1 Tax=Nocardioides terrae TaxID=574651 RepID=A0A1I1EWA7_9ACTN|nr:phage holin family protein [Nocardioides terrae]SFB91394.1 putative membrane protein [Nocardioides terrae]